MIVHQQIGALKKALATNANTSSFTNPVAQTARPSGNLAIDFNAIPGMLFDGAIRFFPYGLGSANDVYSVRVWGWNHIGDQSPGNILWLPALLGEYACTLGAAAGVASSPVLNTELFCDTITVVSEPTYTADVTRKGATEIMSPANDTAAWLRMRLHGIELLSFDFDQTTNTPTANLLYELLAENY